MKFRVRNIALIAVCCGVLMAPRVAGAQAPPSGGSFESGLTAASPNVAPQQPAKSGAGAVVTGALVGAGAALAATALAAARYGENEGGRFCGRCLTQWSV